jgi:hypothetical protein
MNHETDRRCHNGTAAQYAPLGSFHMLTPHVLPANDLELGERSEILYLPSNSGVNFFSPRYHLISW